MPAAFIGHGFTETLAIELGGDGIRANAIAPGAVAGERVHRVLLASDAAKSISGQTISIDGDSQAAE
ncbi:hypothetical protein A5787_22870 [Mycobacterium sp. 852002-50816_SCH5313054-b]|nr:hypothetical protein A5787_22870 [Mycobacterium sp. 852002-50816_SCH5313054-b]